MPPESPQSEPPSKSDNSVNGCSRGALRLLLLNSGLRLAQLVKQVSNAPSWPSSSPNVKTEHLIRPRDFQETDLGLMMLTLDLQRAAAMARELLTRAEQAELQLVEEQMRAMGLEPSALDPLTPSPPSEPHSDI